MRYDGSDWVDTTLTIPSSATVAAGTTEVLKFTTSHTGTIAELDLDELGDVDLTTTAPVTNDVLQYDGSNWVPAAGGSGDTPTLAEVLAEGNSDTSNSITVNTITGETQSNASTVIALSRDDSNLDWNGLNIWRDTSSPADNDSVGNIAWKMDDDGGTFTEMAKIGVNVTDVSAGNVDSDITFNIMANGTMSEVGRFDGTNKKLVVGAGLSINGGISASLTNVPVVIDAATSSSTTTWSAQRYIRTGTPAVDMELGGASWWGMNNSSGLTIYAQQDAMIADFTASGEDGKIVWKTQKDGTLTNSLELIAGQVKISDEYTLPNTDGSNGQVMLTDGSGNVDWYDFDIDALTNVSVTSPVTNQVLIYNNISGQWVNGSMPAPTLAEVTAAGSSTTTTVTLGGILQTGTHLNVAASGNWFSQFRAKTLEVGSTSGTLAYALPGSAGTDGQVLTQQSGTNVGWEDPVKTMTFWNQGIYQMSTSNDTLYRFSTGTSYPNYGLWNSTSSTVPSSLTRTPQRSKGGHIIPFDITGATLTAKVGFAVGTNTAISSSASEYLSDTVNFALYRWPDGGTAVLIDEFTGTINGGNTTGEEEAEITVTGVTLNEGDSLQLVSRCLQEASSTRYMAINYTFHIEY